MIINFLSHRHDNTFFIIIHGRTLLNQSSALVGTSQQHTDRIQPFRNKRIVPGMNLNGRLDRRRRMERRITFTKLTICGMIAFLQPMTFFSIKFQQKYKLWLHGVFCENLSETSFFSEKPNTLPHLLPRLSAALL